MKTIILGALAALTLNATTSGASAEIIEATYIGTVTSDYDFTGIFGFTGTDGLVGDTYTSVYVFDTSNGLNASNGGTFQIYGGVGYAVSSPALRATVTINGRSASIPTPFWNGPMTVTASSEYYEAVYDNNNIGNVSAYSESDSTVTAAAGAYPFTPLAPITYQLGPDDHGVQHYLLDVADNIDCPCGVDQVEYTTVTADVSTLMVSGVPETPTWGMLLLGFAGLTFVGYRASQKRVALAG